MPASPLIAWQPFYTIVGTASATLTGLLFVVITLLARRQERGTGDGIGTFNTPTLFHFGADLFLAAMLSAPWPYLWQASVVLGLAGLAGVIYLGIVTRRMMHSYTQGTYHPVLEDWLSHAVLPIAAYISFLIAAILLSLAATPALFILGASALLLLFVGIHNAWDNLTFIVIRFPNHEQD